MKKIRRYILIVLVSTFCSPLSISWGREFINVSGTSVIKKAIAISDEIFATRDKKATGEKLFKLEILRPYFIVSEEGDYYRIAEKENGDSKIGYVYKNDVKLWTIQEGLCFSPTITLSDRAPLRIWRDFSTVSKYIATKNSKKYGYSYLEAMSFNRRFKKGEMIQPYPILNHKLVDIGDGITRTLYNVLIPVNISEKSVSPYLSILSLKTTDRYKHNSLKADCSACTIKIVEGWIFENQDIYRKCFLMNKPTITELWEFTTILGDNNKNTVEMVQEAKNHLGDMLHDNISMYADVQNVLEKELRINLDSKLFSFQFEWLEELTSIEKKGLQKRFREVADRIKNFINSIRSDSDSEIWIDAAYFSDVGFTPPPMEIKTSSLSSEELQAPVDVIRNYYKDLEQRNATAALNKWIPAKLEDFNWQRRQRGVIEGIDWFRVHKAELAYIDALTAVVAIEVTGKQIKGRSETWAGAIELESIDGNWKIVRMKLFRK